MAVGVRKTVRSERQIGTQPFGFFSICGGRGRIEKAGKTRTGRWNSREQAHQEPKGGTKKGWKHDENSREAGKRYKFAAMG